MKSDAHDVMQKYFEKVERDLSRLCGPPQPSPSPDHRGYNGMMRAALRGEKCRATEPFRSIMLT